MQHCSRSESKVGKAAEVGNMINKRRSLRGKGEENGKCHPEQSGVISHGQEKNDVRVFQHMGRKAVAMVLGLGQDKGKTALDNDSVKIK